jgi:hypothetical protein
MEMWQTLWFNENMDISSFGRLRNNKTGTVWKLMSDGGGYASATVYSSPAKKSKSYKIHRLVAEAFLPKIEGKNHINHKDFDKKNNNISNLEWCTAQENIAHYYQYNFKHKISPEQVFHIRANIEKVGVRKLAKELNISEGYIMSVANGEFFPNIHKTLIRDKKPSIPIPVFQYDFNMNLIKEYKSMTHCSKETGFRLSKIQMVLSGQKRIYKGSIFRSEGYKQTKRRKKKEVYIIKGKKLIEKYDINGIYIKSFSTLSDAAKNAKCSGQNIKRAASGLQKTAMGFIWKYVEPTGNPG